MLELRYLFVVPSDKVDQQGIGIVGVEFPQPGAILLGSITISWSFGGYQVDDAALNEVRALGP